MFSFNIRFRKATDEEINNELEKTKKTNEDVFIPKVMNFTTAENFART